MEFNNHIDIVKKLVPALSLNERQEILAYFNVYEKYAKEFSERATADLKSHPVFGKLINSMTKEMQEANNKISITLQKDAIVNDKWQPYIEYQIMQGVNYAKMGLDFKSWYEVISMVRNYLNPYLIKEYGTGEKFISAINGMNIFMDIAMGIIGEAYMQEKKQIINEDAKKIKKLNEGLKKSENLYRTLIEKNADMMTLAHPDGKVLYISPSVTNILGFTFEEYNSRPAFEFIHPDDLSGLMDKMMRIINEPGKSFYSQHRLLHKNGTHFWCEGTITNMLHDSDIGALVSNFRNINERKKSEEEIQKLNQELEQKVVDRTIQLDRTINQLEEYKHFFINSNDFACIANMDGYFVTINPQFEKILGYSKNELLENQFLKFIHPDDIEATLKEVEKLKSGALTLNFVNRYRKKDGTYIWMEWSTYPDVAGGKQYAIARDITERKKAEDQLLSVNNELEAFTYSVSHDLRAPLRAINGYAEMLNEDHGNNLDHDGKRIIGNITYNATKMGILIDELLAFSRLGRKEVVKKLINMNDLTEGVLSEVNKTYPNSAKIEVNKLHDIKADYGLLHQVMYNLISNAIKYSSKEKKPIIKITSESVNGEIVFSIKDNGVGFDMKYSDKLFGVFQRLHSQEEFEGTGVGLAIVQRVIAKHDGRVWAEGEINKGAKFNFSLTKN